MDSKGIKEVPGAKIVADFSVYIDKSQENYVYAGATTDLSGLDSGQLHEGSKHKNNCIINL
jgi:hypothetical protein